MLGCVGGGLVSERVGSARVAVAQVGLSGLLCLVAPAFPLLPVPAALTLMVLWGAVVAGDSPQFSTLTAQTAPPGRVGTALTATTCIGFFLTIPSLQLITTLSEGSSPWLAMLALAPGPAMSVWAMRPLLSPKS